MQVLPLAGPPRPPDLVGLGGVEASPAESLPDLFDQADGDEGADGDQDAGQWQPSRVEPSLHRGTIDRHQAQDELSDEHVVEHGIRQAVGGASATEDALHLRRRGDRSGDLPEHEGPIVDAHALGVGVLVLIGVVVGALSRQEELHDLWRRIEEHHPTRNHLQLAHVAVTVRQHLAVHELFLPRVPWPASHKLRLSGLQSVRDCRPDISADVDQEHLRNGQRLREAEELAEGRGDLRDFRAQSVHDGFLQILARQAALLDAVDN
mmetsp:Transcript_85637/g.239791  ORF Transcript_85637/g.239791 Transcript_85637/m.239791 type:complete len:264 (+) Transcript_85637:79-870(+)